MELNLLETPLINQINKVAIDSFKLSSSNNISNENDLIELTTKIVHKYLDVASISYNQIEIEVKEHLVHPTTYNLVLKCIDKTWYFNQAFSFRKNDFDIFLRLPKIINELFEHYGKDFRLVFSHLHNIEFETLKDSGCDFNLFLISKVHCDSLFVFLENFNFYDELLNSNHRIFLNNKISLSIRNQRFDFRTIIDYESFIPKSAHGLKIEELIKDDTILANFESNILKKLGLMLDFTNNNKNDIYKLIVEVFCYVYPDKENLKITKNQDNISIEALSYKFKSPVICENSISVQSNVQNIFWEINSVLAELGITKRIFSYNNQKYFINEMTEGLYLINLFDSKRIYISHKKLPDIMILYSERQYFGKILNIEDKNSEIQKVFGLK